MTLFVIGLALFLGVHLVRVVAPGLREAAIERFGDNVWKGLYSVASLVGLVLVGRGYSAAYGETALLYDIPSWGRVVPWVLMAAAFVLIVAAYVPAGRIKRAVGDPMLIATMLWAGAHLFVRSDWLHVLLFGGFLAWAAVDLVSVRARRARGIVSGPPIPEASNPWVGDGLALFAGLGLHLAFMAFAHLWLFGVSPVG